MDMEKIGVGLVGCGYVTNGHLKAWAKTPSARILAVADLNEDLARRTAEGWHVPRYYTEISNLMKQKDISLIDICTPPQTHMEIAVQAMEAGYSTLIEKPMTMTVEDAEKILNCQRRTRSKAGVIHNWLFEPPMLKAETYIKEGRLGDVLDVSVEALATESDSMASNQKHWCHSLRGGRFSEMLAHPIYLMRHFLGDIKLEDVSVGKVGKYPWMKSDELCATFRSGEKLGRAYATFNAPRDAIFVNLYGTKAILKLDIINATVIKLPKRETSRFSKASDSLKQASQLLASTARDMAKIASRKWLSGHEKCIQLFAQSVLLGGEPPVSIEEASKVIRLLDEMCIRIDDEEKQANSSK